MDDGKAGEGPARAQTWSPDSYDRNARFVSDMAGAVFDWLAPGPGESILDLGCGDGALTAKIASAGANVIGIDISESLLQAARGRGLDVRVMDGETLDFPAGFDAVFTNAALHWMTNPRAVVAGAARVLKPGGRFVGEFGGKGNVAAIVTAMRAAARIFDGDEQLAGPWFFPTPDEYRAMLEEAGFTVERIGLFARPTPLPTGMAGWLTTFRKAFFDQFPEPVRGKVVDEVIGLLRPSLQDTQGNWTADYMRLRFAARL